MRRLFLLPIEPLEERYTGAWFRWLPETFSKVFEVVNVTGEPLTTTVETGAFLDLHSTLHYKAAQLQKVARLFKEGKVRDGDAFFIADLEFWGVESIRYLARLSGLAVKVFGFLHAASYTRGDFMEPMTDLGRHMEVGWIATCDLVFVGSEYHRQAVIQRRIMPAHCPELADRIVVTGNPWRSQVARDLARTSPYWSEEREIDVVFPHRPDKEKRPEAFLDAVEHLPPSCHVAFTTGRPTYRSTNDPESVQRVHDLTRDPDRNVSIVASLRNRDFYAILRGSKVIVSTAHEENFGYAIVEGMTMGALPLLPAMASYPELVQGDERFLYHPGIGAIELANRVQALVEAPEWWREDVQVYARTFDISEARILGRMITG